MAHTDIPDAEKKIGTRDTDVPWFNEDIGNKLGNSARRLLEKYSNIPADEVESHVYAIRDRAWKVWPYPCIGQFRFLDLAIATHPQYSIVLDRLKTCQERFLDLGCCFGQELRKLVSEGAPSENCYGCDLRPEFWDLGYALFKDKDTLKSRFLTADIFDPKSALASLQREIDIIYAGSFLHLFGYEQQVDVCKRIVSILKPVQGSMLLGRQVGNLIAGEKVHRTNASGSMYRHNAESFEKMWEEVGVATGTKWRVEARLVNIEGQEWATDSARHGEDMRRLQFAVFREVQ